MKVISLYFFALCAFTALPTVLFAQARATDRAPTAPTVKPAQSQISSPPGGSSTSSVTAPLNSNYRLDNLPNIYIPEVEGSVEREALMNSKASRENKIIVEKALSGWKPGSSYVKGSVGAVELVDSLPSSENRKGDNDEVIKLARTALEEALKGGANVIDEDLKAVGKYLSAEDLKRYRAEADDTKSVLSGLGKALTFSKYAIVGAEAARAETEVQQNEILAEGGYEFAKDLAANGVKEVIPKLFGPKSAAVLLGPVAWVGAVGIDVATPVKIGRDEQELIRDTSGAVPLAEKQEALKRMLSAIERCNFCQGKGQSQQLLELSDVVYREANRAGRKR